jgi:hypothetical protein
MHERIAVLVLQDLREVGVGRGLREVELVEARLLS